MKWPWNYVAFYGLEVPKMSFSYACNWNYSITSSFRQKRFVKNKIVARDNCPVDWHGQRFSKISFQSRETYVVRVNVKDDEYSALGEYLGFLIFPRFNCGNDFLDLLRNDTITSTIGFAGKFSVKIFQLKIFNADWTCSTDRTTDHTMSYCTVFFRIHHRIVGGKKSQAMGFNNTRTVRGIYPEKIMIWKIVSAREKF